MQAFARRQIALAPEPLLHGGGQAVERNAQPNLQQPSAIGSVSSKTASLVKLRMAKLSICAMGQWWAAPVASMRSMVSLRENIETGVS